MLQSRRTRQNVRNDEQVKEKLRRLKDMMAGCGDGGIPAGTRDTLCSAVQQLKHNRDMSQKLLNGEFAALICDIH